MYPFVRVRSVSYVDMGGEGESADSRLAGQPRAIFRWDQLRSRTQHVREALRIITGALWSAPWARIGLPVPDPGPQHDRHWTRNGGRRAAGRCTAYAARDAWAALSRSALVPDEWIPGMHGKRTKKMGW